MKTEYLNRTATFTAKNLHKLFEEAGEEVVLRPDADLVDILTLAAASKLMLEAVTQEAFGGDRSAVVTLRGEDYAVKAKAALDRVAACAMATQTDRKEEGESLARVFHVIGACAYLSALVEDKLFGSDHVEEHEAVSKEETDG